MKTITRYILAAAKVGRDIIACASSGDEIVGVIQYVLLAYPDPASLMEAALRLEIPDVPLSPASHDGEPFVPLKLTTHTSTVEYETLELIWQHIPPCRRVLSLVTVFNSSIDGVSLQHLCHCVKGCQCLICIAKTRDCRVGVFLSHDLVFGGRPYIGNGEDFIFRVDGGKTLTAYHWTKKNDFFCAIRDGALLFGGGGEGAGLLLREGFTVSSYSCDTFGNTPLFGSASNVPVISVEVFALE